MNIAYYSHYFRPEIGAPSARIDDLARKWLEMGHQVQVVTCFPNHPTGCVYPGYESARYLKEDLNRIQVNRHWTYITPNKGFLKKTLGHLSFPLGARLFSERHLGRPDVVIGTSPTFFAATAAASFARRRHIPFIMEVRDLWPAIFVELGVIRNMRVIRALQMWEMRLYKRATGVVVVTDAFRENLISRGIDRNKVVTIPNGADIDFWCAGSASGELRKNLNLEKCFVVLYIGAHGISHALERVIEAANELKDSPDIHFLFVGEGAEKDKLVRKAHQLQLANITFKDSVGKEEVRDYYAMADVCLVPLKDIPLFQTFIPSKMFEIMSMGRPIIGSVRGEAADILRRSGSAEVIEPENSAGLAQAILHLYTDSDLRRQMGERGRRFVAEHYSRQSLARTYSDHLEQAIEDYRRR